MMIGNERYAEYESNNTMAQSNTTMAQSNNTMAQSNISMIDRRESNRRRLPGVVGYESPL